MSRRKIKDPNRKREKRPRGEHARLHEISKRRGMVTTFKSASKQARKKPTHEQESRLSDEVLEGVILEQGDDE